MKDVFFSIFNISSLKNKYRIVDDVERLSCYGSEVNDTESYVIVIVRVDTSLTRDGVCEIESFASYPICYRSHENSI